MGKVDEYIKRRKIRLLSRDGETPSFSDRVTAFKVRRAARLDARNKELEMLKNGLTFSKYNGNIAMDEFVEGDHPRDENGQFAKANSSEPSGESEAENEKPQPTTPSAKEIRSRLIGQKTQDGQTVKSVSDHAVQRVQERKIGFDTIENLFQSGNVRPGHTPNTICYETDKHRVVLDKSNGKIVTVMHRGNRGGKK